MPPLTADDGLLSDLRGDFGEAWVETIAIAARCEAYSARGDTKKTDLVVQGDHGELIRVQVKATEAATSNAAGYTFQLDMATYDRLRTGSTRGFVALVVVHQKQPYWTGSTKPYSQVRATAYLLELTGAPTIDGQASVSLSFPPSTMLTQQRFVDIFAEEGGNDADA